MVEQELKSGILDSTDGIDKILAEALVKSTDEYRTGYDDGQNEAVDAIMKTVHKQADTFFGETVGYAEVFYSILSDMVTPGAIRQYRIGLDYTTETPTVLAIISQNCIDSLYEIENTAAKFDLLLAQKYKRFYSFWVMIDGDLDQEMIERDFPWCKRR